MAHPAGGRLNRRAFASLAGRGVVGLLAAVRLPAPPRRPERLVERWSWAMGQPVRVRVFASTEDEGLDACAAALAELRRVEARLSLFDDASDVCELNRRAGRGPMRIDHDLRAALGAALEFQHTTGGAFDVTVEPLMRVWGFHRARRDAPGPLEITAAREAVQAAIVRLDGDRAELVSAHTQIDFGGIGVGYGLDRAGMVLRRRGIRAALVDVSGDCLAIGSPPGEAGWLVTIADPSRTGSVGSTRLADAGLATSANTVEVRRYGAAVRGHVMNPATGWPAHGVRQVTVVARTATAADAWSTGALVTGRRPHGALGAWLVA